MKTMTLEQAIIIMEDRMARIEHSHRAIPGKNKEERTRMKVSDEARRSMLDALKELANEDFEELNARQKPYGEWWKLND